MADDANFCNGRLRLIAFLRVVEHDLPQRPSRFKQRMPLAGEEHGRTVASELLEAESALRIPRVREEVPSLDVEAEFDAPRSPALVEVGSNESIAVSDIAVLGHRNSIAHPQRADKPLSAGHPNPPSTQKRRFPVKGLALLRTTTSHGLPDPVDAHMAPTVPITELDPIDDSQSILPHAKRVRLQRLGPHAGRMQEFSHAQRSEGRGTTISKPHRDRQQRSAKKAEIAVSTKATPPVPNRIKQHTVGRICFVADGFAGTELHMVPVRNTPQRRKAVTRKPKPHLAVSGLALAGGVLPSPAIQCHGSLAASPSLDHSPANMVTGYQNRAGTPQLPLLRTDSAATFKEVEYKSAGHCQRAVHDQLSSITAPRRESGSSGSDGLAEEQSTDGEGNDSDDDLHEIVGTAHSMPFPRRSTVVEDHRYFESAMYHLSAEKEHGQAIGDLFFQ
ncbi:hypothetical protein BDU57DRAFT_536642 [Ampelomyces quisqualis]|uniref:Uncharacterized protein n=1 Tax=Ampelomyces quisqualis TaxID=50730 RepID=A0A6A5QW45_AMPQU|nr:hypothetical protein BDU57DRAFT_536642 [Ampelomyces quisqualis]